MNAEPKRFRWRTVPVGILGAFGCISLAFTVFSVVYMLYTSWTKEPMYSPGPPPGFTKEGFAVAGITAFSGAILIMASILWWRGRWWLAILIVATLWLILQTMAAMGLIRD